MALRYEAGKNTCHTHALLDIK